MKGQNVIQLIFLTFHLIALLNEIGFFKNCKYIVEKNTMNIYFSATTLDWASQHSEKSKKKKKALTLLRK